MNAETATQPPAPRRIRPEIQALRAIAVGTVVIFHYWPHLITGGYVGVDVFFAISGFLITAHLVREVDRTSKVSLGGFWARRARRILPAALLVLLFCAVATYIWVPLNLWDQFFGEIKASTLYIENWNLASQAVDYLGAENRPSPVQHYWSLSVEEQFYIFWPVVILIAMTLARRGSALLRRRAIAGMLIVLTITSLAYSIWKTGADPAAAFFVTPTRVWEFGAGGILALAAVSTARPALRSVVSWAGLIAILAAAFFYSPDTPFPGAAALLPILGTLALIWAGTPELRWSPLGWMQLRPVQWVGDTSYSIYLWHWPLLILTPFVLFHSLSSATKLILLAITIALSALTKRLVEDPIRSGPLLAGKRPLRTLAYALPATLLVLAASFAGISALHQRQDADRRASQELLTSNAPCLGAAARDPENQPCINPKLRLSVAPTPATAREIVIPHNATKANMSPLCQGGLKREGVLELCTIGVAPAEAKRQMVLIGDSHSRRWRPGLNAVAVQQGWSVVSIVRRRCPLSTVKRSREGPDRVGCERWKKELPAWLAKHPEIDSLMATQSTATRASKSFFEQQVKGYLSGFRSLPASIKHIVVLRDNPRAAPTTLDCVERAMNQGKPAGPACALERQAVLFPDPLAAAAKALNRPGAGVVDLTDFYCGPKLCYEVIGGVLVHSDEHHVTELFNRTLAPFLLRALNRGQWLNR